MVDDSNNSVTAGARGEFTMIGAQRHTSLTDPVTNSALARAALGCLLALAVLATPALAQAPAAVSDVVVVPVPRTPTSLTVSWSAPDNAGKPAITGYDVQYRETDIFNWTTVRQDAASTSVIITGLRSNAFYDVQVRALNTDGSGPWSSTAVGATSPDPEVVFANHPLIPDDLGPGDSFRLLFVTADTKAATSTSNIDYSDFITAPTPHIVEPGNLVSVGGVVNIAQTAVLSLPGADARLRTDTTWTATDRGVPIYWLNGARVADDYADFYDGSWANADKPRNGLGNPRPLAGTAPWTGTDHDGTELFDGAVSRAMGQATVGVGGLGSSAVGAGPLNGGAAFASSEQRPLYGLWQVMVVDANRRLLRNHFKPHDGDDDTRAAVRAQLFTTGPQSLGYAIDLISIDRAVDIDEEFLGDVALYTTDANGKPDLVDGLHATLILERTEQYHWELTVPDGMVLEPSTTYALVFLGDGGGTYPKIWTKDADTEDAPDEGWSLADALLYRSGSSWVEDPDGRSLRIEIVGPRRVDLDPVVSIRNRSIREDIGTAVLTVTLSWPSRVSVSVPWSTSELDAVSPDDYTDGRGVLTFAPGATEATIFIPIVDDAVPEEVESFAVTLGPGEGYRSNPSSNVAFAKILDNDGDELVPSRATVNGTTLLLTYNEILDSASTPYPFHFYVTADDNRVEVDQVSVGGSMVTLTLATAVEAGQTVTLDYVSGVGQNQIQDGEGNAAMSFTDWLVTNITGGGTEPPVDGGDGGGTEPPVDGGDGGGGGTPPPGGGGGSGGGGGGGGGGGAPSATVPGAPANLQADGGDEQVTLFWETPENDGGLAITDYEYRINGRGGWVSIDSTLTTYTVTGLVNGTAYVFQVRAVNAVGSSAPSNRAEATPRATVALDFAHFANGASWQSGLVFVNGASHPIRPAVYFYDKAGNPIAAESVVDLTGDLEVQEDGALSVQRAMVPLGELTISTHGQGELVTGSVTVSANGPIGGVLRYAHPDIGVAGVGVGQPVRDALFPARRQAGGIRTAAALHNLGEEAMTVSCRLMSGGIVLEEVEIFLGANGQEARYIEELFTGADTSDFVGSVRCMAPGLFTGVAVEIDAENRILTTLPVVPVARAGGGGQETVLNFAHLANGLGTTSDLVFVNVSPRPSGPGLTPYHAVILPSRPTLYFYDQEGNLLDPASVVDLTGDLMVTEDGALSIQTEMEPLGELTVSTHGRGELVSGSVQVVSEGPLGGVLRYALPGIGVTGVGASQAVRDALFPVRQEGGLDTAAAIHNLSESDLVATCRLMKDGAVLEETEVPLAANGQESQYLEEMFAFTRADVSDFVGSVRCTVPPGEGMFTGVAVEIDEINRILTTLPVVPVTERMDRE